ncbi:diaminopimelate dehydrogenase [Candidatus Pacearchaeota archaeon]|nr:diaminopimelate dehydrogenase [Candidatus Pacearchaeota archaeon]
MPEPRKLKTKIAIVGWGNVGRGVYQAIQKNPDMELIGIISRTPKRVNDEFGNKPDAPLIYALGTVDDNLWKRMEADVAVLCGGSATDLPEQGPYFAQFFNTVDSFDTHAKIPEYFDKMNRVAKGNNHVAVISAGWDPGIFSVERVLGNAFLPGSRAYTFWGRGVSQGHSDALRRVPGVLDAIQYTVPVQEALSSVRSGVNPELTTRQKHMRECFVALKPRANPDEVRKAIVTMPNYFADYNTSVVFETPEQVAKRKKEMPHAGFVLTSGKTGNGNKAVVEYSNTWKSNPEATGSILVACARACHRLSLEGRAGAFTMLDIPPAMLSPLSQEELLRSWM